MRLGITSMGSRVKGPGGSTVSSAFKKLPGMKPIAATGMGEIAKVQKPMKVAEEGASGGDRLRGFISGAGIGGTVGAGAGALWAADTMTRKPGILGRLFLKKPTLSGALRQVGGGAAVGAALGGGIGAMAAKKTEATKVGNVLGCMLWGTRSSPYAGPRTNPFASSATKAANVLGQTRFGERSSPFAGHRTNPFAKTAPPSEMKTAASAEGDVTGMAAALEQLLAGSVEPNSGFDYVQRGLLKAAFAQ